MAVFFTHRKYPQGIIDRALTSVSTITRDMALQANMEITSDQSMVQSVLTYHPTNTKVKNTLTRKFHLLQNAPTAET